MFLLSVIFFLIFKDMELNFVCVLKDVVTCNGFPVDASIQIMMKHLSSHFLNKKTTLIELSIHDFTHWLYWCDKHFEFHLIWIYRLYPSDAHIRCLSTAHFRSTQEMIKRQPVPLPPRGEDIREDFLNFHYAGIYTFKSVHEYTRKCMIMFLWYHWMLQIVTPIRLIVTLFFC